MNEEQQPKVSMVKLTKAQQKNHKEAFDVNEHTHTHTHTNRSFYFSRLSSCSWWESCLQQENSQLLKITKYTGSSLKNAARSIWSQKLERCQGHLTHTKAVFTHPVSLHPQNLRNSWCGRTVGPQSEEQSGDFGCSRRDQNGSQKAWLEVAECEIQNHGGIRGSPGGARGKEHTCQCRSKTQVPSLGQEDPLKEVMATHSSVLSWRIQWMDEQEFIGSHRVEHDGRDLAHMHTYEIEAIATLISPRYWCAHPNQKEGLIWALYQLWRVIERIFIAIIFLLIVVLCSIENKHIYMSKRN